MAIEIDSIELLKKHIEGVMARADHHAQSVYKSVLPIVGLIVWKAMNIRARTNKGEQANMVWFETSKDQYAMVFNHEKAKIEIRERTQQGRTIAFLDNSNSIEDLIKIFENL
ncbi:hypothetical protein [Leptospira meyeri]|uniref:hypothetical protein n=1 Tax=Leptospira meyeri TaxID=29508 RepID=UPI0010837D47|nr:hypothetical protein [Leptospira meyeri]TGM25414.1 hypothetical protein EHQ73_00780 [Leptospira meyeri]